MNSPAIILAATKWWRSKRPLAWDQEEHLRQPTANCRGEIEHALAEAVANMVREKEERK